MIVVDVTTACHCNSVKVFGTILMATKKQPELPHILTGAAFMLSHTAGVVLSSCSEGIQINLTIFGFTLATLVDELLASLWWLQGSNVPQVGLCLTPNME